MDALHQSDRIPSHPIRSNLILDPLVPHSPKPAEHRKIAFFASLLIGSLPFLYGISKGVLDFIKVRKR